MTTGKRTRYRGWRRRPRRLEAHADLTVAQGDARAWFIGIVVLLVVGGAVRRLPRGRRVPSYDQKNLENANYARIDQDISNVIRNKSPWG